MPDGSYKELGKNFEIAKLAAEGMNKHRAAKEAKARMAAGSRNVTMDELIASFRPVKLRTTKSDDTAKEWNRKLDRYGDWFGHLRVSAIQVLDLDIALGQFVPTYDPYRQHKILLKDLFAYAIGKGWRRDVDGNPGDALLPVKLARIKKGKTRRRMNAEQYDAIYQFAPRWVRVAMRFARAIGIRRGDMCNLKMSDFHDGSLWFVPKKTADLKDPKAIKIIPGDELKDIIAEAFSLQPLCPFMIKRHNQFHRCEMAEGREHRSQVMPEQLTRHFKKARDKAVAAHPELFEGLKPKELPSYHEIRALCAWELKEKGVPNEIIQATLGHTTEGMTVHYQTGHVDFEWQEVSSF